MSKKTIIVALILLIIFVSTIFSIAYYIGKNIANNIDIRIVPEGRIEHMSGTRVTLVFQVQFINNGDIDTPEFSADYRIFINKIHVGNGHLPWISIPKKSYVTAKTTITVDLIKLGKVIITNLLQGNLYINITVTGTGHVKILPGIIIDKEFNKTQTVRFI